MAARSGDSIAAHATRALAWPRERAAPAAAVMVVALASSGCEATMLRSATPYPNAGLSISNRDVDVRVERAHLRWWKAEGDTVDVRVKNLTGRAIHVEPDRFELLYSANGELRPYRLREQDGGNGLEGSGGGGVGAGSLGSGVSGGGSSGSSGSGSGSGAGGLVGAGLGLIVLAVGFLPVGIYYLVTQSIREGDKTIGPGEASTFSVDLGGARLDSGERYALELDGGMPPLSGPVPPLLLVRPDQPRFGYGRPSSMEWVFSLHLGGGAIWESTATGGLGGVEIFVGPQWGRLAVGGYVMLGSGSIGAEVRYDHKVTDWMSIVHFGGYGYYWLGGYFGLLAGHGPRLGLEVNFPLDHLTRLGRRESTTHFGVYGHAGPVFLHRRDDVGLEMQFGMSIGLY